MTQIDTDNIEDVLEAISVFYSSKTYAMLSRRLQTVPYMEVIGKSRSETCHSAFLQWLFNAKELFHTVSPPVKSLLRLLSVRSKYNSALMSSELCNAILTDNLQIEDVSAQIERGTKSEIGNGRSDIEITVRITNKCIQNEPSSQIRIVIENKIDSHEGENQCKKYYEHYQGFKDVRETIYVYLAPILSETLSSPHFIKITYQDILDRVIDPLMHDKTSIPERDQSYINMFVENITSLRSSQSKIQIAMDSELKTLLTDFYKNNEALILAAIEAAAPDEIRSKVQEVKTGRDYTSYNLKYTMHGKPVEKNVTAKSRLAKTFVEIYLEMNPNASLSDVQKVLKQVKDNLISTDERSRTYQIEGRDWYIDSGIWGAGSGCFNSLLKVIKENGIEVCDSKGEPIL